MNENIPFPFFISFLFIRNELVILLNGGTLYLIYQQKLISQFK